MTNEKMSRHEHWRYQYRKNRYARHLSRPELNRRIRDIFLNMLIVTPEAKIGLPPINPASVVWLEKWTHVLEEMQLRHGPYPAGFERDILHSEPFPNFASELAGKAATRMAALDLKPETVLIKLGKETYMRALHEYGRLRLQPASFYSRPDLNLAVRDDEMTLPLSFSLTREDIIKLVVNPQDVPGDVTGQRLDIEFVATADFWMYCVTRSIEPRLFVDFDAEACVIIRNPGEFSRRLREGAQESVGKAEFREAQANYVDPLLPKSPKVFVPFSKPFGYAYQKEHRFCWLPREPVAQLQPIDIEIGSLADIADLIVI